MSTISFIGLGGMAHAIAARAVTGGHSIELIGRDPAKAKGLAAELGAGATVGTFGTVPAGDRARRLPRLSALRTATSPAPRPGSRSWR